MKQLWDYDKSDYDIAIKAYIEALKALDDAMPAAPLWNEIASYMNPAYKAVKETIQQLKYMKARVK